MIHTDDDVILIGAGSSLPFNHLDSQQVVLSAFNSLKSVVRILAISSLYKTPAWPDPADPSFVNAVAAVRTGLTPEALLSALHAVEAAFGRVRRDRNAPRTLDLDLLAYGRIQRDSPDGLRLPHPGIAAREFVLAPLCEIAPDWRHPITHETAAAMLAGLSRRVACKL
ncbi:MAG: 2-amino-4-hydroxy-6-hydroxymethyldihydropteridine diphosphokinase [Hyphococcus sp.]